ncbi:MAG: tail fiber domain-containing protein [Pyrinomonadaceae bacterium]
MADKKTRVDLEILFSSGKIPTQSNFADLIASGVSQKDDGLQKASDTPLKIQAPVTVETDAKTPRDLILFYEKIEDDAAKWRMSIRSGGLEISRGAQTDFLIDANGSVGIGTTDVKAKLHIVGGAIMPAIGNSESAGILFPIDAFGGSGDRAYIRYYARSGESTTLEIANKNDADDHISLMPGGNVGIGTTTPGFPLTFADALGDKISLWGQSGANYGFGVQTLLLQIHTDSDTADIAFGSGASSSFKETMRIKGNGNVGIGINPGVALEVAQNKAIRLGNANISSGGDYVHLSNHSWYNGSAWQFDGAVGALYQIGGQTHIWYRHDGKSHTNVMMINSNGNVGIGASNPLGPLSVGDSSVEGSDGYLVIGKKKGGTRHLRMGYDDAFNFVIGDYGHTNGAGTWSSQFAIHWQAPAKSLYINQGGNIGIGTTDVKAKLHVVDGAIMPAAGNSESAGILFPPDAFGGGGDRAYIRYYARSGESTTLEIGNQNDADDHIALMPAGNVGIGTINPTKAKLVVEGWGNPGDFLLRLYMDGGSTADHNRQWGNGSHASIWASNEIIGTAIRIQSDTRIKKVIELPDTGKDLLFINKLNPVKYRFIDTVENGYEIKSGFIAQDVEKINPAMVKRATNFIPNIYCQAEEIKYNASEKTLCISVSNSHDCVAGDKVRIITDKRQLELTVESVISANKLILAGCEEKTEKVFVFGKEVRDFLTLDYNSIFTKGIGAIQELSNQIKELHEGCAQSRAELEAIKSQLKENKEMLNIRLNKTETVG